MSVHAPKNVALRSGSLVSEGSVYIKDLKSQKSGKVYAATILLDDNKDGYVNFNMTF